MVLFCLLSHGFFFGAHFAVGEEDVSSGRDSLAVGKDVEIQKILSDEIDDFLTTEKEEEKPEEEVVFTSPHRLLQELNPEISILGDFLGLATFDSEDEGDHHDEHEDDPEHAHTESGDGFQLQEVELSLQAPLDPFSLAKFFIGIHDGHVHVCEGYVEWTNLPARMQLKLGKFRNNFGVINRWHSHSYPTVDTPLAIENIFGEEGLSGVGGSLTFLLPGLWSHYNELVVEAINGDNARAFSGEGFDHPVGLFHLKNYYDLSEAMYVELGLSGAIGENSADLENLTYLEGVDFSLVWIPPRQAKYLGLEVRAEAFFEQRETPDSRIDTFSFFAFGDLKFSRRWTSGVRFDYVQDSFDKSKRSYAIAPFLTFWQSEFVRLRLQYSGLHQEEDWDHLVVFQSTWALGPHKHEKY